MQYCSYVIGKSHTKAKELAFSLAQSYDNCSKQDLVWRYRQVHSRTCRETPVKVVFGVDLQTRHEMEKLLRRIEPRQLTAHVVTRLLQVVVRVSLEQHVTVQIVALRAAALAVVVDVVC